MNIERAIEVLKVKVDFLRCYEESGMLKEHEKEQLQALDKAIEVMTKVHNYDKEMKELEEYLKETRSTSDEKIDVFHTPDYKVIGKRK